MDDQLPSKRGALRRSAVVEMDGLLYQYLKRAVAAIPYFFDDCFLSTFFAQ